MKKALVLIMLALILLIVLFILPRYTKYHLPIPQVQRPKEEKNLALEKLKSHAELAKEYVHQQKFATNYCFLIDMSLHSGTNRFFIFDLKADTVINSGLVAHGSCNSYYLEAAKFSNTPNCGCSSIGKYKVGYKYKGRFGNAYKLFGLDETNSNAFKRAVVLHAYDCVPDDETYPQPICNSLGCPMVSYSFLDTIKQYIDKSSKPVLLWIYN